MMNDHTGDMHVLPIYEALLAESDAGTCATVIENQGEGRANTNTAGAQHANPAPAAQSAAGQHD